MSPDAVPPAITTARLDIATRDGDGPPTLVFTHGWADDRSSWDGVIDGIGGRFPCVSWSLRAHGSSEVTAPGSYTRAHALADFDAVLERVDGPVVLVGHSLGGYLSLAQTLRHPERVTALVLVGAGPGFRKDTARQRWNENVAAQAAKLGVPPGSETLSMHEDSWVIDELGTIEQPTLVILGERDSAFAASAAVFEKQLDVRRTLVVPDAGHSVHAKRPEPVAAAIVEFVSALAD